MSDWITIDGAEYNIHKFRGKAYYIGEETVLDSTKTEIGFVSSRGPITVVVATIDGNSVQQRTFDENRHVLLDTEDDVIENLLEMHAEHKRSERAAKRQRRSEIVENMNPNCMTDDPFVIHPYYTGRDKGAIMSGNKIAGFYSEGHAWKYIFTTLQPNDDRACTNYRVVRLSEYLVD